MAGYNACVTAINEATGGAFNEDELETILSDLQRRAQAKQRASGGTMGDREAYATAAAELAEENRAAAARQAMNARMNLVKRLAIDARVLAAPNVIDAIKAEVHGINTPLPGGNKFSAEAEARSIANLYQGGLALALDRAGLRTAARSGALARDWVRELAELNRRDGKPGLTGSKVARDIAEIVHRYQALARKNLNAEGAWIGDLDGYVAHQNHDAFKIRTAGYDGWRDFTAPKLDADRTFDGVEDREKFLRGTYQALATGIHLSAEGGLGFKDPAFTGPGNLAARLSEARLLHFKDADAWLDYQERFGQADPFLAVRNALGAAARDTALMRRWGTNPAAEFQSMLRRLQETLRDTRSMEATRLRMASSGLQNLFNWLDGTNDRPANRLGARVNSTIRQVVQLGKLGNVAFTHFGSLAFKAAELRYRGVGLFEAYADTMYSLWRGRGTGETREIMDLLHAGLEGMSRDMLGPYSLGDDLPGAMSKTTNNFFQAAGLTYLLNAEKAGSEYVVSRLHGRLLDRDWTQLPPEVRRDFGNYGITPEHWAALQAVPDHAAIDGRRFLTPDAAERTGLAPRAAQDLASRLAVLYHDAADRSIVTPGIPEKALFLGSTQPGTPAGEVLRYIAQFKQWPAAAIRQGLGRELYGGQTRYAAFAGIVHLAVASTILGYLRMTLVDLLKGRNPRPPNDPKTVVAAMAQGGGLGILGDYLFGEYSRFGQSVSETALGPVLGQGLSSVIDVWNRMKQAAEDPHGKHDIKPELFKLVLDNAPFLNLFYVRSVLNYAFLWQWQEALSPGYLRRFEERVKHQNRQTFWLRPISGKVGPSAVRAPSLLGGPP